MSGKPIHLGFSLLFIALLGIVCFAAHAGTVQYSYDELGRLRSVVFADGSSVEYTFDPAGNRTQVVHSSPFSSFNASPGIVTTGGPAVLSWQSSNAVLASIDNGVGVLTPPTGGTVTVNPTQTTTYTLTLTLPGGAIVRGRSTVTVVPPPTGTINATPMTILVGGSSVLSWSSAGASSATIDHGLGAVTPTSGTITVTPAASTTYTLTLTNPAGTVITPRVTVSLNHAPTASNDSISTNENVAATIDPRSNDSDADGDGLVIQSVTQPLHGTATFTGSSITYKPGLNFYGSDNFNYVVSDGKGGTATAVVSATVSFVNQPPIANDDGIVRTKLNTTFDPRVNDIDPEGDPLTIISASNGTYGTVTILTGGTALKYTGAAMPSGTTDSFQYTISDGHGHTATGHVVVSMPDDPGCVGPTC